MTTSSRGRVSVAARLARREVRRHPWRHLLVALLILVPVLAALTCFSGIVTWQDAMHRQDSFTDPPAGAFTFPAEDGPRAQTADGSAASLRHLGLPADTRVETAWNGVDWFITDHQRADRKGPQLAGAQMIEATAGSASADRVVVTKGRLPLTKDEILLTEPVADAGGWSVGDTVEAARGGQSFDVVGIGVLGDETNRPAAAVTHQPLSYWQQPIVGFDNVYLGDEWVNGRSHQQVTAWPPASEVRAGFQHDGSYTASSSADLDDRVRPGLLMASVAVCAVVAVVASAAFAISSRRQLRSVGLLATVGADPATIRWAMVLQGAIPGLVAGVAAVAIGVVVVAVGNANDVLERLGHISGSHLILSVSGAAIAVGLGLASGIAAAWQPARTVSRIPVLSALAGRRPLGPIRAQVPVIGAVLWGVGAVMLAIAFGGRAGLVEQLQPFLVIGGIAALALGGVGLAPVLVALLDPLARRVRGPSRMGLRGLVRHRTQSAATVAAVAVALALPVGLLTARNAAAPTPMASSSYTYGPGGEVQPEDQPPSVFRSDPDVAHVEIEGAMDSKAAADATEAVAHVMGPSASILHSISMADEAGRWRNIATIDERVADSILVPWAATAIAQGKAISLEDAPGPVTLRADGDEATFDTVLAPGGAGTWLPAASAAYLVGRGALGDVGSRRADQSRSVVREQPLTTREHDAIAVLQGERSRPLTTDPTLEAVRAAVSPDAPTPAGSFYESGVDIVDTARHVDSSSLEAVDASNGTEKALDAVLVAAIVVALALALLVLTITLSLRSVDGEAEQRAAFAAGVSPARLRRQRAFEGVALALLGAVLALPLGWIPVAAAQWGAADSSVLSDGATTQIARGFSSPGWMVVPILLAPALLAGALWTVVPWLTATVRAARHRGPRDVLLAPGA
ncbi:FtsX-like permease family protein [Aquihabitans sp. McL0605]|uniref:FtsX-like permease family protein n=1 Tax=Aquihabitans sp. McL0605 TaxID=3415671 RepID=UPI003CE84885